MPAVHRALLIYCLLTAVISWSLWAPLVWLGPLRAGQSPLKYLHLLGALGPAIAGLICARLFGGPAAFAVLRGRILRWRVPLKWHLIAWLGPFALLALALGMAALWEGGIANPFIGNAEFAALPLVLYWSAVLVFYGFGEEIGWRGFVLPVLQNQFPALLSTLILSVIWALWHLPLFWFSPGLAALDSGGIVGWGLSLLTGAVILTWLANSTGGGVLIAAGFHATMDLAFAPSLSPLATSLIGGMVTVWGVGVLIGTGALARPTKVTLPLRPDAAGQT